MFLFQTNPIHFQLVTHRDARDLAGLAADAVHPTVPRNARVAVDGKRRKRFGLNKNKDDRNDLGKWWFSMLCFLDNFLVLTEKFCDIFLC